MEKERSVMVIDNDLAVRELLGQCIEDMNLSIEVLYADSALKEILESRQTSPGLILLNLWLEEEGEETGGLMLLQKFRQDSRFKTTPIIIVSADGRKETKDECKRLGANSFIVKPFNLEEVEAEINKIFGTGI